MCCGIFWSLGTASLQTCVGQSAPGLLTGVDTDRLLSDSVLDLLGTHAGIVINLATTSDLGSRLRPRLAVFRVYQALPLTLRAVSTWLTSVSIRPDTSLESAFAHYEDSATRSLAGIFIPEGRRRLSVDRYGLSTSGHGKEDRQFAHRC